MRVMVTGATGFIGYHTALALLEHGHEVCVLVRSVDKLLNLFGEDRFAGVVRGDITDSAAVARAVAGCDAVVHSAAMVSTSAGDADRVYHTNVEGTRRVIGEALEAGARQVIHVSSITALYDPAAERLDENSAPGPGIARSGYGRSKIACEHMLREFQAAGQPVHLTYPAAVIGPDDPALTEPHRGILALLLGFIPIIPGSGNQYVDVRDIAEVHRRLLEAPPGADRFPLGGTFLSWPDHARYLRQLTGRRFLTLPVSGGLTRAAGTLMDRLGPHLPRLAEQLPLSGEGCQYASHWVPLDNSHVERTLDFRFRPIEESLRDTIIWLQEAGHLSPGLAGRLAQSR